MNYEKPTFKIVRNIDRKEILKFEEEALHWWNIEGKVKLLHRINPLRLNYILERSNGAFRKTVLDVGCGGGIFAESIAREGAIVTGLDVSLALLKVARLHALETGVNINYIHDTVEEYAIHHARQYDIITCMEILEHVPDPQSVVKACAQLVKKDGQVFFSTINRNIKAWLSIIIGAEYILRVIPKGTHNIKKFIKPAELLRWIDETSLKERHIVGLHYNPFTDKYHLSSCIDINYILHTSY